MRSQRSNSGWIVAVLLWAILTFVVGTLPPVLADEQRALSVVGRSKGGSKPCAHGSASDRAHAVWMLSFFGSAASKAVPDLIDRLRQAGNVRREIDALTALGRIGPAAAPAVPLLIAGYLAEGCNLAKTGNFGGGDGGLPGVALIGIVAPAVPALIEVLTGPNKEMRACAAMHLGRIGPAAKAAVPAPCARFTRINRRSITRRLPHCGTRPLLLSGASDPPPGKPSLP